MPRTWFCGKTETSFASSTPLTYPGIAPSRPPDAVRAAIRGGTDARPALSSTKAPARASNRRSRSRRRETSAWLRKSRSRLSLTGSLCRGGQAGLGAQNLLGDRHRLAVLFDHRRLGPDEVRRHRRHLAYIEHLTIAFGALQRRAQARDLRTQRLLDPVEGDHALVDLPEEARAHRLHSVERTFDKFGRGGGDAFDENRAHVLRIRSHRPEGELCNRLEKSVQADRPRVG